MRFVKRCLISPALFRHTPCSNSKNYILCCNFECHDPDNVLRIFFRLSHFQIRPHYYYGPQAVVTFLYSPHTLSLLLAWKLTYEPIILSLSVKIKFLKNVILNLMKVVFSNSKYRALSQIAMDIAQVFFASVVITPILAGMSIDKWYIIIIGLTCSGIIWTTSLYFAEKGKL